MSWLRCVIVTVALLPTVLSADEMLDQVGKLIFAGNQQEARAMLIKARDTYAAAGDASKEAAAWLLLGITDSSSNDPTTAREELQQAADKFATQHDYFGAWMSLHTLALMETAQGQTAAALAAHERILTLLESAAKPDVQFTMASMQMIAPVFGAPKDALGPFASNPAILKPILLQFMEIVSRDAYGATLLDSGDLNRAETQLIRASEAGMLFGGMFDVTIQAHIGDLRKQQWRLDEARASYLKALDGAKSMGPAFTPSIVGRVDPFMEVNVLKSLAELELLSGRLDEALVWNDRALRAIRATGNAKREAALLENRGELLRNGGRDEAAIPILSDALALAVSTKDLYRQASIYMNLGSLHTYRGNYGTAVKYLEKAIELYQTLQEPYLEAPTWIALAEVYIILEGDKNAEIALDNAKKLAEKSGFKLAASMVDVVIASKSMMNGQGSASDARAAMDAFLRMPEAKSFMFNEGAQATMREFVNFSERGKGSTEVLPTPNGPPLFAAFNAMLQGKAALERGEYEKAREHFKHALSINPSLDHKSGLQALIGATYWKEGKAADAIRHFRQAADTLDTSAADVKVEELLAGYLGSNRRVYFDLLVEMLVDGGELQEAFAHAERARARTFLQLIGNHRLNPKQSADPRLIAEAENLRADIAIREEAAIGVKPEEAPRFKEELERARQHYRAVMIRVKATSAEYADLTTIAPLQIGTVRDGLPAETTLISYYLSAHAVHAWIIDRQSINYELLPLDRDGVKQLMCWTDWLGSNGTRGADVPECGEQTDALPDVAYRALFAPLRKHIHHKKLILVPHGVLHYVPFAALHDAETGRYVVEDYTITYAPSASAIQFLRSKESRVDGSALVLGDPATPISSLKRLPGAKEEATQVAELLGTTARLGDDAREKDLYELGGKVDLVHIAAHGLYDPANPLFSRIALTPSADFDGSLTVHEILSSVDLSGVNLVVLSACRSAVGERSGGDEVVGLTRALLYAGTPGVISTLWNIDDAASAGLMKEFYRHLTSGEAVAEALQGAQVAVLKSKSFQHPKYWAAFTLSGDPQGRWGPAKPPATATPAK
jgi:tetratricopeptide (TPR) repeat protein